MALLNNFSCTLFEPQFLLCVFHKWLYFRDGKQGTSVVRMFSSRPQRAQTSNCNTMHPSGLKKIRCMTVHGKLCNSAYMIDCLLRKVKGLLNRVITTIHHRTTVRKRELELIRTLCCTHMLIIREVCKINPDRSRRTCFFFSWKMKKKRKKFFFT